MYLASHYIRLLGKCQVTLFLEKARMRHLLSSLRMHFPHDAPASLDTAQQPIDRFQEKSANVLLMIVVSLWTPASFPLRFFWARAPPAFGGMRPRQRIGNVVGL